MPSTPSSKNLKDAHMQEAFNPGAPAIANTLAGYFNQDESKKAAPQTLPEEPKVGAPDTKGNALEQCMNGRHLMYDSSANKAVDVGSCADVHP